MILLVSGTRLGHPLVEETLEAWHRDAARRVFTLYVGDAKGVDAQATHWAVSRGADVRVFKAQWKKFGLQAGPFRNQEMVMEATKSALYVECFLFPSRRSKGTFDCLSRVINAGHMYHVVGEREDYL